MIRDMIWAIVTAVSAVGVSGMLIRVWEFL
jgi:hypothetical protein